MSLLVTLIVLVLTGLTLLRRAGEDFQANRPYLYVLGTILAGAIGLLLSGAYENPVLRGLLISLFAVFVLVPGLLSHLRDSLYRRGKFELAITVQRLVTYLVWSRTERDSLLLSRSAREVIQGNVEKAEEMLDRLEQRDHLSEEVEQKIQQHRVVISGNRSNWRKVVRRFEQLNKKGRVPLWNATLIHGARAYAELGECSRARRLLDTVFSRELNTQEEMAAGTVRMAVEMLDGHLQQGEVELERMMGRWGEQLPEPFYPYWKARGLQSIGRYREARELLETARQKTEPDEEDWREAIDRRMQELEEKEDTADPLRQTTSVEPGQGRPAFVQPDPGSATTEVTGVPGEGDEAGAPPPEVRRFIEKINQVPVATTVFIAIIGVIFLFMYIFARPAGLEDANPTKDPVVLIVFGMKADYMIDERWKLAEQAEKMESENTDNEKQETAEDEYSKKEFKQLKSRLVALFGEGSEGNPDFPRGQYWRLATCTFLHIGFLHLLLNCYGLWILGKLLENIIGWRDYIIIYLISGLTGSIASWKFAGHQSSAGASGAIFGLLGAALAVTILEKEGMPEQIRDRLLGPLLFWTVLNLVIGFLIPRIDNAGHIGGLVGGFITTALIVAGAAASAAEKSRLFEGFCWFLCFSLLGFYGWAFIQGVTFVVQYFPQL